MAIVRVNTNLINDWDSFHLVWKEAFGFPDFYGKNMDAWIDCMSYLTVNNGMTKVKISSDEILHIEITETEDFNKRLPELLDELIECVAFVNNRFIEAKETARIALVFI